MSGIVAPDAATQAKVTNEYNPTYAYVTIRAQKLVDGLGSDANPSGYYFELKDSPTGSWAKGSGYSDVNGRVSLGQQSFYRTGDYVLMERKDKSHAPDGIPMVFDERIVPVHVEMSVVHTAKGDVNVATVTYDGSTEEPVFTNVIEKGSLTVTKEPDPSIPEGKEFAYTLNATDGTKQTFSLKAGESKTIEGLAHGAEYTLVETDPGAGYAAQGERTRTGSVFGGQAYTETFKDVYAVSGSFQIEVKKEYLGETLEAGMFLFDLASADDPDNPVDTASNMRDGTVLFEPVDVTAPGTYRYYVTERIPDDEGRVSYDRNAIVATVEAKDAGDGTLSCDVTYGGARELVNAVETAQLELSVTAEGTTAAHEGYEFFYVLELWDKAGMPIDTTVALAPVDGSSETSYVRSGQAFPLTPGSDVTLGLPLDATFKLTQVDAPGFDTFSEGATGTIRGGDALKASFRNVYSSSGNATVRASVRLEGGQLTPGRFAFQLVGSDGTVLEEVENGKAPAQAKNVATGTEGEVSNGSAPAVEPAAATPSVGEVVFTDIPLTAMDHGVERGYVLRQVDRSEPDMDYDLRDVAVTLVPADDAAGTMVAKLDYDGKDSAEFVNRLSSDDPTPPSRPDDGDDPSQNPSDDPAQGSDDKPKTPEDQNPSDIQEEEVSNPDAGVDDSGLARAEKDSDGEQGALAKTGDVMPAVAVVVTALLAMLAIMTVWRRRPGRGAHERR